MGTAVLYSVTEIAQRFMKGTAVEQPFVQDMPSKVLLVHFWLAHFILFIYLKAKVSSEQMLSNKSPSM